MTTNNYFVKYISTSNQKDLLDNSSEQNIYQCSKFPLGQWSVTTQTASRTAELSFLKLSAEQQNSPFHWSSGPWPLKLSAELSFPLVHGTINCHEKSEAFSHLTLSMGPTPLSSSLSEGQWLLMWSDQLTHIALLHCWLTPFGGPVKIVGQ